MKNKYLFKLLKLQNFFFILISIKYVFQIGLK